MHQGAAASFPELSSGPERTILEQPEQNLGRTAEARREGPNTLLIRAQGTSQRARQCVVTLGTEFDAASDFPVAAGDRRAHLLARLEWGNGGGAFSAEVDFKQGVQVGLSASSVSVTALYDPDDAPGAVDARLSKAQLTAAVVWGTRAPRALVTRSFPEVRLPPGAAQTFALPKFAYGALIASPNVAFYSAVIGTDFDVLFHGGPTPVDRPLFRPPMEAWRASTNGDGVKFPEAARFITLANLTLPETALNLFFALNL